MNIIIRCLPRQKRTAACLATVMKRCAGSWDCVPTVNSIWRILSSIILLWSFIRITISATYAEFVRVEDIVRKVDDTTAGIVDKKNGFVLSEIEENSFRSLALSWDSLPAATVELSELRAAKNSKSGFVKLVCNFLVSQQLLSDNQERYYPTDRFRAVVENYFDESRGRIMELLDQSGEERDEHAAD